MTKTITVEHFPTPADREKGHAVIDEQEASKKISRKPGPIEWVLFKEKWRIKDGLITAAEVFIDTLDRESALWVQDTTYARFTVKRAREIMAEAIAKNQTRHLGYRLRAAESNSKAMDEAAKQRLRAIAAQRKIDKKNDAQRKIEKTKKEKR